MGTKGGRGVEVYKVYNCLAKTAWLKFSLTIISAQNIINIHYNQHAHSNNRRKQFEMHIMFQGTVASSLIEMYKRFGGV
jgi:hypothetical protein